VDVAGLVSDHLANMDFDLMLAGRGALDARAGAVLGLIASRLDLPMAANADGLELDRDGLTARILTRTGSERVRLPLPSMISLRNETTPPPIAPLRNLIEAIEKPVALIEMQLAGIVADPGPVQVGPSAMRIPRRLSGSPGEMAAALMDELTRAGILPQPRPE
jgi:electron transfer flavoprotein alpha/beta subunit